MSNKAVCRTAPATPGLLITHTMDVTMVKAKALTRLDILQFWVAFTKSLIKPVKAVPDESVPEPKSLLIMPVALADTSSNA